MTSFLVKSILENPLPRCDVNLKLNTVHYPPQRMKYFCTCICYIIDRVQIPPSFASNRFECEIGPLQTKYVMEKGLNDASYNSDVPENHHFSLKTNI